KERKSIEKIYSVLTQNPEEAKAMADSLVITLLKQGLDQGRVEGRKEGREEGREEGEIIRSKKNILSCLSKRFKHPVPRDIQDSVNSYSDLIALESLFQRSLDSDSLDEFREYLVR
ncbi:MAG: hypothetical protein LBB88_03235, partial [Planctomycetaceae bacterium]|nr:hypothetical protein [Planctomycetaceae bacterium]